MKAMNVVLFCGGRGSATIIHELLRWPHIQLTLIVNAYDDGLSTGALRGFVENMLGPSDFRKNLSYLLDPFSEGQYALKYLLNFRIPPSISDHDINRLIIFGQTKNVEFLIQPLRESFIQLNACIADQLYDWLNHFFNYMQEIKQSFDFRDCAFGNLIFAGAYLAENKNFNAAAKAMSALVHSRALLVNVSQGESRVLVGLKKNGELLEREANIVGPQSKDAILNIFFLERPIRQVEWQAMLTKNVEEKKAWLYHQEVLPQISPEAIKALKEADMIVYGPGTQHSSLLPSYRIAYPYLKQSQAVKIFVVNLATDHDIQSLSASDIVDCALSYMDDPLNQHRVMTHILLEQSHSNLPKGQLGEDQYYKHAQQIVGGFINDQKREVHNGRAVVETMFDIYKKSILDQAKQDRPLLDIFIDINKRSLFLDMLMEELLEIDWKKNFSHVNVMVNQASIDHLVSSESIHIEQSMRTGIFPEVSYFNDWLHHGKSEYLVLLTGDGEYRFRDVMFGIRLLEQSHFGAVFGTRNQSRQQFKASIRAAYGEKKLLRYFSFLGAFLMSAIFALRYGIIFSDLLTGFRLFKRSKLQHIIQHQAFENAKTPVSIAKLLITNQIDIAELPINYRTFLGFSDPHWRFHRGIKNLLSALMK